MTSEVFSLITNAYSNRQYEGRLPDLMSHVSKNIMFQEDMLNIIKI